MLFNSIVLLYYYYYYYYYYYKMRHDVWIMQISDASLVYVVFKGHQPGVYSKWPDCQEQVHGLLQVQLL